MTIRLLPLLALFLATPAFADGDPDGTFGASGVAKSGVSDAGGLVRGLVAQPDGKIVICDRGNVSAATADDFYVVRFNKDGSLDASFGSGGRTFIDFGGNDFCSAAAVQPDGRLLFAGLTANIGAGTSNFAVARLNSDGTPDLSFGPANGHMQMSFASTTAGANALALQGNGNILVVGTAASSVAIAQLLPSGALDSTFGVNGEIVTHFALVGGSVQGRAAAIDSQGRIVIVGAGPDGNGNANFMATRLLASGDTDQSFGVEGFARASFIYGGSNQAVATAVAIQGDDSVILAGTADLSPTTSSQDIEYAAARWKENGTLDSSFGGGGTAVIPFAGGNNFARSVALQSNGLIVLAGAALTSTGSMPTATRLKANGSVDADFGLRTYTLGALPSGFNGVIVKDVDVYAAGFLSVMGGDDDVVVKLNNDQVFGNGFN